MSHRIFKETARMLRKKELQLQQLQKEGKELPHSDRRRKKYLARIKKEEGYLSYLKERYSKTGRNDLVKKLEPKDE